VADDSKRRRGRKRGKGQRHAQSQRPDEKAQEDLEEPAEEEEEPEPEQEDDDAGSGGRRFGLPFGRGGDDDNGDDEDEGEPEKPRERQTRSASAAPMDFWRRGKARPYREAADRQRQMGLWQRITGLYFPPWVPVVGIIVLVFGILAVLFILRGQTGAPRIGVDHWHATYEYIVCGQKQPNFPEWRAGVHTHDDGIIHMHPFDPGEEGAGARLVRWFDYGGGKLDGDEVRAPGSSNTYKNGDLCDDGQEGVVQVFANRQKLDNYNRYIPQDGDSVQIIFGPEPDEATSGSGISIPESEATRTIEIDVTDAGEPRVDSEFSETNLEVTTGEAVKLLITNTGTVSHGLEVAGADDDFDTANDNFTSQPATIGAGESGTAVVRFNDPGTFRFQDTTFADAATGTFTVTGDPVQPVTLTITDDGTDVGTEFRPSSINVVAGKTVNLVVKNEGELTHGITIFGDDGVLRTDDDTTTSPDVISPGEEGTVSFILNEIGEVPFVDVQDVSGTFVVVEDLPDPNATPGPDDDPDVEVDVELEVRATLDGFEPAQLTVGAGESFRITVTNGDAFLQNLRIAGPDAEFDTADDLVSEEVENEGDTGVLVGTIDDPGTYEFWDDFHTNLTGTLVVQ
jgi:uncharacterized cupredoxin-like copper-binding protein